jgi:hypothetical protein
VNYTKPEIVLAGSAIAEIQGVDKGGNFTETIYLSNGTIAAYEADE